MPETIPALFTRQAAVYGPRPLFFVKRGTYHSITWEQAQQDVRALSAFLLESRVGAGDRVLILSENRPEWGVADLAIQSVGAWTVPIYPSLTVPDIEVICRDCQPVLGIASSPEQAKKLLDVRPAVSSLRVIIMEPTAPGSMDLLEWQRVLEQGREVLEKHRAALEQRRSSIQPDDTATLIYTSGTTGEPKGVMLSHQNLLSNVSACLEVIPLTHDDLHLSFLPLSHVFERMAGWYLMLAAGTSVAYAENMETIPQNMLEVRPTLRDQPMSRRLDGGIWRMPS